MNTASAGSAQSQSSSLSGRAIAGIVIAVLAAFIVFFLAAFCFFRRRKRQLTRDPIPVADGAKDEKQVVDNKTQYPAFHPVELDNTEAALHPQELTAMS
jgi:hypothetical protein